MVEDERAVGECVERRLVPALSSRFGLDPFGVERRVDGVGPADAARVKLVPKCHKLLVVLVTAERAGTMARSERGRLVQEEQLREPARLP